MDPVSAVGIAAASTQFAGQIITINVTILEFYQKVKDAPESVRQQLIHIEQLCGITRLIIHNKALQTAAVESVLRTCLKLISDVQTELQKYRLTLETILESSYKRMSWAALKDKKFGKMFEDLEKQKATLVLCIQEADS